MPHEGHVEPPARGIGGYSALPSAPVGVEQRVTRSILLNALLAVDRTPGLALSAPQIVQIRAVLLTHRTVTLPPPGVFGRLTRQVLSVEQLAFVQGVRGQAVANFPNLPDQIGDPVWRAALSAVARRAEMDVASVNLPLSYPQPDAALVPGTPFDADAARGLYRLVYEAPPLTLSRRQAAALLPTLKACTWADRFEGARKDGIVRLLTASQRQALRIRLQAAVRPPDPTSDTRLVNLSDDEFLRVLEARPKRPR